MIDTYAVEVQVNSNPLTIETLVASLPGMLFQFHLAGEGTLAFSEVSASCCTLCELDSQEVKQDAQRLLQLFHPDDRIEFERFITHTAKTMEPGQWEGRLITPTGCSKWVQARIRVEQQANQTIGIGLLTDISDRKQLEAQLQHCSCQLERTQQELHQAQAQLIQSEKMSSLGQLVAGVAHEINNPVNFIYGNLTYATEYTEGLLSLLDLYQQHYPEPIPEIIEEAEAIDLEFLSEDLPKLMSSMKVGAERIQKIVASLRTFSRMDEAEFKAIDLHEGLDNTLMILQNRLKAKPEHPAIEIIKDYGRIPPVECYAGPLNQVFMNILVNAIDALDECYDSGCPINSPAVTIQTLVVPEERVQIRIRDNGPGMPEAIQKQIFDPFFTTKPVGKGTGMGMSISYEIIVEKHHGSLRCISNSGQGSEFIIEIPIQQQGSSKEN